MIGLRARSWGITAKLIVPFVTIFVAAMTLLGVMFMRSQSAALSRTLDKKAEMLVRNMANGLGDLFMMGEFEQLQRLLDGAKKFDEDVEYAIIVAQDGRGMASTDAALKNQTLTRNDFERSALKVADFVRRETARADLFEVVMPVRFQGQTPGVLRIGVSTRQVQATARAAMWTLLGVAALALGAGIAIYVVVARRVTRPLGQAVERLEELASGAADLTLRLPVASRDETGRLASVLNRFLDNLQHLVREIRDTSLEVGAASQQLAGASGQLATAAQAQAASLEETAASLEEMTATVKQNADNARQASQLAHTSRGAAEKGGDVVASAVTSMGGITEASKRIAEIISVIDEIAFQTNLLALNAAVEAARAGDQGRGFAVVAAEVRNLAQRSAGAAKEIKTLIRDSVGRVDDGSRLVNQSGDTLQEIVTAVKRASDIVAEIAGACEEQSQGIDQVNRAITQVDELVQNNATQTEDLTKTARALAGHAGHLQTLVGRFRLDGAAAAVASPAVARAPERPTTPPAPRRARREAELAGAAG